MKTENSPASNVPAQSGLTPVIQLADLLGGQRSTTRTSADTGAIKALLTQLQSKDYSSQLQSILQAVAGQTPGIQARYANAVGARSGSNAPVTAALDKLMVDASLKGQQQIAQLENQNAATQASLANSLAQATRSSTTQAGTNLGRATAGLGLLTAADKALNTQTVQGIGKKLGTFWDGLNFGGGTSADGGLQSASEAMFAGSTGGLDLSGLADYAPDFGAAFDGLTGFDLSGGTSALEDLGQYFADGGLVGRDGKSAPQKFAEGGTVSVRSAGGRRSATPEYIPNAITRNSAVSPSATAAERSQAVHGNEQGASADAAAPGDPGSISPGQALGLGLSLALGNIPGFAAQIASIQTNNQAIAPTVQALMTDNPIMQAIQTAKAITALASGADASPLGTAGVSVSPESMANNSLGLAAPSQNAVAGPMSVPDPTSLNPTTIESIIAAATAEAAATSAGSLGAGSGGSVGSEGSDSGAVGVGDGAGGGGDGSPGGWKSGGEVDGPGTGTSDSIPARLSDGEYVIPADVVERLGVGFFDRLRAQFHTPAA